MSKRKVYAYRHPPIHECYTHNQTSLQQRVFRKADPVPALCDYNPHFDTTSCLAGKNGVRVSGTVTVLFIPSGLLSLLSWKKFLLWLWGKSIYVGMLSELYESDVKVMYWHTIIHALSSTEITKNPTLKFGHEDRLSVLL
jgi:hypothetical protein